ncbi:hypothetical protein A3A76_03900 [Candidatus Woesebacteria bacterium RIFCSPLOWO2_01_FULL_39_23]|uniref:Glycosyltransferase 2-like domain-containing protein n=1 Tax=Candidatus Woesebacteria bacterium RIFCSPHIGHO2_01_FULL_40_22 TaxID=1802499 RepID=A0A1F7YK03_9BACT|nr:MAG: hypothetical protein A2141_00115 [Candidatus Woesebacteria bacterium RBG_16_40_11]OGM27597.1 MAG: hypothetical protein A2628_02300 [Candidatus Woesebacteria bacterium RIFCSPHIGHO2_01_FULL_40_22]OGM36750.1 MAG: hypothetical protein A3E41_03150 [Candidatus Woesebacteria bacterium RIFCSPHIGHO2_12_FULL_38_9]OGM62771.1 MAG: hypothetical protein A3A76_03900 [Candidatus Woesebacteria bacterium RIFCSPLOWO2_01_FULL_39_23]
MGKVSVVINTLNEEKNLPRAIASVKGLADEIIVVDNYSDDKTVDIAKKLGAKVYMHPRTDYVEPVRNYAISKATGEWLFILDADEELSPGLGKILQKLVRKPKADYYRVPRKNVIFGKWIKHTDWWPDLNIRFFRNGHVVWSEIIHSIPVTTGKGLDLEVNEGNAIIHHNYQSIEQYIERLNRYTTIQAKFIIKSGHKFKWTDLLKESSHEFLRRYFTAQGYKDGLHGLVLSILQGFSEFVVYLKVWQAFKFEPRDIGVTTVMKEIRKVEKELHYWRADTLLHEVGGLKQRIKRKLRLP